MKEKTATATAASSEDTQYGETRNTPASTPRESIPRIDLIRDKDFQAANSHVFGSFYSLRWFVRMHRARLIDAGAVVILTDRLFVMPEKFMAEIHAIGAVSARRLKTPA